MLSISGTRTCGLRSERRQLFERAHGPLPQHALQASDRTKKQPKCGQRRLRCQPAAIQMYFYMWYISTSSALFFLRRPLGSMVLINPA